MALKSLSSVRGAIHDVARLKLMSGTCNVIVVSDTTLNIIQNYAIDEIAFQSRYGVGFEGGYYIPIDDAHPDFDFVLDVIRLYRLEVNDLTCDLVDALTNIRASIDSATATMAACCEKMAGATTQDIEDPPHDGTISVGQPGDDFGTTAEYLDAKCNVANAIYDTVLAAVIALDVNLDDLAVIGGLTAMLGGILVAAGPVGWAIAGVSLSVISVLVLLLSYQINFVDLQAALGEEHSDMVGALYAANDTMDANEGFIDALEAAPTSLGGDEITLVRLILTNNMLNQLFDPRSDLVGYQSASPITCTSSLWVIAQGVPTTPLTGTEITVDSAYGSLSPFVPHHHGTYIYIPSGIGNRIIDITVLTGWTDNGIGPPTLTNAGYINELGVWTYAGSGVDPIDFIDNVCVKDGWYLDVTSGTPFTVTLNYGATCP